MSLCLEGLTPANLAFLNAHASAFASGTSALQGPLGKLVAHSVQKALTGNQGIFATALEIAGAHWSHELYEMRCAGFRVGLTNWQKVRYLPDGLGKLAQRLKSHSQFCSMPIRQLIVAKKPFLSEGNFGGDLLTYQNINDVVVQALGIGALYEEDSDHVMTWDLPPDFLILGPEILFGSEAVHIQLTTTMSPPREVRDLLEQEDAWPVWLWPGEPVFASNGSHRPGYRKVHGVEVKTSGLLRHDLFHVWWSSWQGRARRLESVAIYDGLETAVGVPITFDSPSPILQAADAVLSGVNMGLDEERVRYKDYLQKIYGALQEPRWVLALHDQIRERFPRHPHLSSESLSAAALYRHR